jgi:LmbE family N-acetylglucosaminyl deacetylase
MGTDGLDESSARLNSPRRSSPIALALVAHPDDIEFYMAGTLLLLKERDWNIHYWTLSSGSCGSIEQDATTLRVIRRRESQRAARILGAIYHRSLADDLEIFYDLKTLRRVTALIREVAPTIVLTHSPHDYMEDHTNACRLAVTATFARGMPNFKTRPSRSAIPGDVTLYHAMPHGLRDPLRRRVMPGAFVNTTSVHTTKRAALAAHHSQKAWLDSSQGMDSYLQAMEDMSLAVGKLSRRFRHAEGWRRHLHLGFGTEEADPLAEALGPNYLVNRAYERALARQPR